MEGFRLNPDRKYVDMIISGIEKKNGHCPCRLDTNASTLCPCDNFVQNKVCHCKLYIKIEETTEK